MGTGLKIAFLAGFLSRRSSGVREVVEQLSHSLSERGHELRVYGLEDAQWRNGDNALWCGAPTMMSRVLGPSKLGYAPGWQPDLHRFGADVVHLHGLWMASASIAATWAKNTPSGVLAVSPHGMLSKVALGYSTRRKRIARFLYQDRCFAATDLLHATSDLEAEEIRSFGLPAPITVIPLGINDMPSHLRVSSRPNSRTVISLGRLHPVKGLDRLLRVWARVEAEFPEWSLQIVGEDAGNGYGAKLMEMAADIGLQRVVFPGAAYGDDKWRALQEAEVFVLPSETENFALTVPEALLAGLPVVSTDGAPWTTLPREGCGWCVARSDASLADALTQAIRLTAGERHAMGQVGRDWVLRNFRWPTIAEHLERDYLTALSAKVGST